MLIRKEQALCAEIDDLIEQANRRDQKEDKAQTTGNQARVDCLIAAALEAGGKNNVTVIVLTPWQSKIPKK